MVLRSRGAEARFLGHAVEVVRGSQTTVIPVTAVERVSADDDGTIRLTLDAFAADEGGVPGSFEFQPFSRPEAQAFVGLVGSAVAQARRAEEAVAVPTRRERAGRWSAMSRRARRVATVVGVYAAATLTDIAVIGKPDALILLAPAFAGTFMGMGILWSAGDMREFWSSLLSRRSLRRTGISVPAKITSQRLPNGGFTISFPVYSFRTVDGASITAHDRSGWEREAGDHEYTIRYDPDDPSRVAGPVGRFAVLGYTVVALFMTAFLAIVPAMTVATLAHALSH